MILGEKGSVASRWVRQETLPDATFKERKMSHYLHVVLRIMYHRQYPVEPSLLAVFFQQQKHINGNMEEISWTDRVKIKQHY